jgi:hypothetical protein
MPDEGLVFVQIRVRFQSAGRTMLLVKYCLCRNDPGTV